MYFINNDDQVKAIAFSLLIKKFIQNQSRFQPYQLQFIDTLMSITYFKDSKDSSRSYYRITRAINGIEKQEYVRIKSPTEKGKAAALKKAKAIDEKLANWQRSIRALKDLKGENLVLPNGKVIGLQLQYRKRIENRIDIEFKLRVKLPDTPPYYRSVSIKRWGLEGAFKKAIHII